MISGYTSVTSRPLRATSFTVPSARFTATTRAPSYLISNSQPSRVNARSVISASIGSSAPFGSSRTGAFAARASSTTSALRLTCARSSSMVSPDATEAGSASTSSRERSAPFTLASQSQLLPPSPFMRTSAKRPRSLWPSSRRSSLPAASPSAGEVPSTV